MVADRDWNNHGDFFTDGRVPDGQRNGSSYRR
jgi:hypothetical protein